MKNMKGIPYATQWIDKSDLEAVNNALKKPYLTQGPMIQDFEKAVAKYCGAKYAVAVSSGTAGLHLACLAAGIKRGDEVITSAITFAASSNCVLYCGAKPVFADIDENTVEIDPLGIKKKLARKTKAIIPVDFAGQSADLKEIKKLAQRKGLIIIEDAAHSLGSSYRGYKTGSGKYSDMTVLSFHAVKHITTGEGGMVLTNDKKLFEKLKLLRSHGITREAAFLGADGGPWYYEMQDLGFNYRITDFQCALGLSQLKKLDKFVRRRRQIAALYDKAFSGIKGIKPLKAAPFAKCSYHLYVLRFDPKYFKASRQTIFNEYRKRGIGVNVHYIPVYLHPYYKKLGYKKGLCPKAERYYKQAVTIPLYPKMSQKDAAKVIKVTKDVVKKFGKDVKK